MKRQLTVVIPAFNESENFTAGKLESIQQYLTAKKYNWEVVVVDDGSADGSNLKIKQWLSGRDHWRFIQNPHQGKAATVMTGLTAARHPYVLFSDFDQATPIGEVEKLLPFIDKGYEIIIGSREVKGALRLKEPFYRHLMGKVFNLVVKLFVIRGISDTQCGFKIFKKSVGVDLFNRLRVYRPRKERYAFTGAFDVELLFLAGKAGVKVAEVPVHWNHEPTTRVNPVRDSIRMFFDVIKIRLAYLLGQYR